MLESERRENGENIRRFDYLDLISRRRTRDLSPGIRGKRSPAHVIRVMKGIVMQRKYSLVASRLRCVDSDTGRVRERRVKTNMQSSSLWPCIDEPGPGVILTVVRTEERGGGYLVRNDERG